MRVYFALMPRASSRSPSAAQPARVVATFGRRFVLALDDDAEVSARAKGRKLQPVCGDCVDASPLENEPDWLVVGIRPRENELTRPSSRGRVEVLAANLDALVVVAADLPAPDWFIVDRYLCAAELIGAAAAVAFNKIDLGEMAASSAEALAEYAAAGYVTLHLSAAEHTNLDALLEFLEQRRAILVGQSGVGKSSLVNRLLQRSMLPTAAISEKRREGRHTTVSSVMLSLPNGGEVIDSPGVRDYAPAVAQPADVVRGYREIQEAGTACRFANCRHLREPECNVKALVAAGRIGSRRYESYKRLLALAEKLQRP